MERWWPTWCPSTMLWQENTDKITLTQPTLPADDLRPLCGNRLLVSDDCRLCIIEGHTTSLWVFASFLPKRFCSSHEARPSCCSSGECHLIIESLVPLPPCHNYSLCTFFIAYLSTDQIRVGGGGVFWGDWTSRRTTLSCFSPDPDERVWGLGQSLVGWRLRIFTCCPGVQFCWMLRSAVFWVSPRVTGKLVS